MCNGILVKWKTKDEIEKVKNEIEKNLGKQLLVSVTGKKNPLVKIVDFEENISNEELTECILKQNKFQRGENATLKKLKTGITEYRLGTCV